MMRRAALVFALVVTLVLTAIAPAGAYPTSFRPGAAGIGDPYFPLAGNGGYDVRHYGLDITYTPATDALVGIATISVVATQDLSAFNLDFDGLTLRSLTVDGLPAAWSRAAGELTVTPLRGLRRGQAFTVVARYDGVPQLIQDPNLGASGVFATDDGMVVVGQPEVASTWFPVNDHPLDKASYTIRITAPRGLESVSNGVLLSRTTRRGWTTTTWDAREPMASYLATATVGEYRVKAAQAGGIRYWDALDPKLFTPPAAPRTGSRMALTQDGEPSYKRLTRTIAVPAGGANLSFQVTRDTEEGWDFFFVEARTAGAEDWTTLPDANGHSLTDTGAVCVYAPDLHPFLLHYVTPGADTCADTGASGGWSAASGGSEGYEQWSIDLSRYAGRSVEISLSAVNDQSITFAGAFVDDVVVSTGAGSTSFEDDGDVLDGWAPGGPPAGSPANPKNWISGTAADVPPTLGDRAAGSLAREPEILGFLSGAFGPYPFSASGGIVDSTEAFGFALENQTRPVYAQGFFGTPQSGDAVVVHELAHQWYGDSLALARWQDIWLNEGFATYAEWAVERARGPRHRTGELRLPVRHLRRRPRVLGVAGRRPRPAAPVRRAGLRARRHDAAHAAPDRRRRRLLPHPADLGVGPPRRQRHHRRVRRPGRADLRTVAGLVLPDLAVQPHPPGGGGVGADRREGRRPLARRQALAAALTECQVRSSTSSSRWCSPSR
jgi:hypothetical protein